MTAKLIRLVNPKLEKRYTAAANSVRETIYANVADGNDIHCDDVTIALARSVYECFYQMRDGGLSPSTVCREIDDFLQLMNDNLPKVKEMVWDWEKKG